MAQILAHPHFSAMLDDWIIVRDAYAGEGAVKAKAQDYLPATSGMILDGMATPGQLGSKMYAAYLLRAVWHDLFKEAVEAYIGILHQKPPTITLPGAIKDIRSNFGETPEQLLRRINGEQLTTGRLGLLCDLPIEPDPANPMPYIAMYKAEAIRNWDNAESESQQSILNYVVLDESGLDRDEVNIFNWIVRARYRVCQRGDIINPIDQGEYGTALFKAALGSDGIPLYDASLIKSPNLRGTTLKNIPFTFINTKDLLPTPDAPPLLGLANMMFAIYRGEADYRQNLFMQGQDTLVTIGGVKITDTTDPDAALRVGAGARIDMEAGGDAKYIGVSSLGLPEQRTALQNDRSRAEVRAGQLVNTRVGDKESGEALKTRLAAQTATLNQIALSGAAGLENALRQAAMWRGADPAGVKVEPNLEFSSTLVTGQDAFQLMQAKDLGLPISYRSLHAWAVDRGLTKRNFDEDFAEIQSENDIVAMLKDPVAQAAAKAALAAKTKVPAGPVKP